MTTDDSLQPVVDVQEVMREVRSRARERKQAEAQQLERLNHVLHPDLGHRIASIRRILQELPGEACRIGDMPPRPPTLRGKAGYVLVWIMRRALFWLIPSIQRFELKMIDVIDQQALVMEDILGSMLELSRQLADVRGKTGGAENDIAGAAQKLKELRASFTRLEKTLQAEVRLQQEILNQMESRAPSSGNAHER